MPIIFSFLALAFFLMVSYSASGKDFTGGFFIRAFFSFLAAYLLYRWMTAKDRKVQRELNSEFPPEWEKFLLDKVPFYAMLKDESRPRFRQEVRRFILTKRITGVNTEIDDTDKLLVASSAVIPVFGFKGWQYRNLNEVLLYPNAFSQEFDVKGGKNRNVQGMVGNGYMNGMMILSKPELHRSFSNSNDKHNVGIHEFVHLLDDSDGVIDGIPDSLLDKQYSIPWLEMMSSEMNAILKRKSDINPYGAMNKQEFFAVASEYFFERPELMAEKHPELYKLLKKVFRQNMLRKFRNYRNRIAGKLKKRKKVA